MKTKLSLGALAFLLIAAIFTARAQQPPTEPVAGSSPLINERLKCGVSISGPKWIQVNDDDDNENGVWDWVGPPQPGGAEPTDGEKRTGVITVTATLPDTCPNAVGICVTAKGTSLQRIDGFWPGKVVITDKAGNVVRQWGNDDQAREKKVVKEQPYSFSISPGETAICHVWFEGYHHSEAGPPDVLVEAKSADGTPCGLHGHLGPQIHKLSVYQVDLDVDSNNNEGFDFTGGSDEEDPIEASERPEIPGKIIAVPINPDADGDGVEDWKDGFGVAGGTLGNTRFVPMVVHLPEPYDPEQAVVEFSYKMSDPRAVSPGTPQVPVGFRIWTSDAGVLRSLDPLPASPPTSATGFFVPAGQEISWKLLAANCTPAASGNYDGPAVIVFLETVFSWGSGTSPFQPKEKITVAAGPSYGSIHAVVVPPADPPPITTDTVHIAVACTGSLKISGPDTLVVNDNDDNKSDTWDKDDPAVPTGDPQIKVVTVEAEAGNQPLTVNILPALPGVDQIIGGYFLDGTKIGRHSLPLTIPAYQKVVANLHVEGVRNSSALEDVTITASVAGSGYNSGSNLCVVTPPDVSHKLTVYQVDLDVDSDNNNGFDLPEGSAGEDQIEASDNPGNSGKLIAVPLKPDADGDGVFDWLDGFGVDGGTLGNTRFIPLVVALPTPYNPLQATISFTYRMSDPRSLAAGAAQTASGFRIWTADAGVMRSIAAPAAGAPAPGSGYFIPAGDSIPWQVLAATCAPAASGQYSGPAVIVFLETVISGGSGGPRFDPKEKITVTANSAYGATGTTSEDTVHIAVHCTGKVEINGDKTILVNDSDDNSNDEWDKFDTPISPADPHVIPITVTATAGDEAITVTVTSDQCGSGLGNLIRGFFPDASKSTPLMQTQFDVPPNTPVTKVFYIEGISNSATVDDVVITAAATGSVPYGATQSGAYDNKAVHKLTVYQVDLDVDSNNNEGLTFTSGSVAEDEIEASDKPVHPGKIIVANVSDNDGDGTLDFADHHIWNSDTGNVFTPMVLTIPEPIDLAKAIIKFTYSASSPVAIPATGTGTPTDPYIHTPNPGSLRIWKKDGSQPRTMDTVTAGGDFAESDVGYTSAELGIDSSTRSVTLYVEGITPTAEPIKVEVLREATSSPGSSSSPTGSYESYPCNVTDTLKVMCVKLSIEAIAFNFKPTSASDEALNIREDFATPIALPEYVKGGRNKPAAYIRDTTIKMAVKFKVEPPSITSLNIIGISDNIKGALGDTASKSVTFSSGISNEGTDDLLTTTMDDSEFVEFTVSNNTPNKIYKSEESWQWKISNINGSTINSLNTEKTSGHTVYTILDTPTAPWNQIPDDAKNPWVKALEYSCFWAADQADEHNTQMKITTAIYDSGTFQYDGPSTVPGGDGSSKYVDWIDGTFDLTLCLSDLNKRVISDVNCTDCGTMVMLFSNIVGCDLWSSKMSDTWPPSSGFECNQIIAIGAGGGSWRVPFSGSFSYHEVGWTGACSDSDSIYDPCLKVDTDGDPSIAPRMDQYVVGMMFNDGASGTPFAYRESLAKPGILGYEKCIAQPATKQRRYPK